MNFLSLFVLIPLLTLIGLLCCKKPSQIRVLCAGAGIALLALALTLLGLYIQARHGGATDPML